MRFLEIHTLLPPYGVYTLEPTSYIFFIAMALLLKIGYYRHLGASGVLAILLPLGQQRQRQPFFSLPSRLLFFNAPISLVLATMRGAVGNIKHLTEMLLFLTLSLSRS
jgi:hypothetical protein